MFDNRFKPQGRKLLIQAARPVGFGQAGLPPLLDVLIGETGSVLEIGVGLDAEAERIAANGAYLSPGWTDLHAHVWHGGTDISIRPELAGARHGVTTIVDAGSAGEGNFVGLREFIIEPARENIYAFLNLGSIGLVACNRVSELMDMRSIDIDRTLATIRANRDVIVGIKVRASAVITGGWDLVPVKLAKKLGRIAGVPIMVHVGEPPPLYDDILPLLGEGDIVTHCFNGKQGGSLLEDEDLYRLVESSAERGVVLDIGHGGASFSFEVGRIALERGLKPTTISTDLHNRSMDGAVWDLGTTMSKLLSLGMGFEDVVVAASTAPKKAIGKPHQDLLMVGKPAEFTLFTLEESRLEVRDSQGVTAMLDKVFTPAWAILGAEAVKAHRYQPAPDQGGPKACPHCGFVS
jgi:dihydroorotase